MKKNFLLVCQSVYDDLNLNCLWCFLIGVLILFLLSSATLPPLHNLLIFTSLLAFSAFIVLNPLLITGLVFLARLAPSFHLFRRFSIDLHFFSWILCWTLFLLPHNPVSCLSLEIQSNIFSSCCVRVDDEIERFHTFIFFGERQTLLTCQDVSSDVCVVDVCLIWFASVLCVQSSFSRSFLFPDAIFFPDFGLFHSSFFPDNFRLLHSFMFAVFFSHLSHRMTNFFCSSFAFVTTDTRTASWLAHHIVCVCKCMPPPLTQAYTHWWYGHSDNTWWTNQVVIDARNTVVNRLIRENFFFNFFHLVYVN